MSEQFWIGGFYVDLSRNQITHNNQTQTLAPKALAVLTYLAKHHGQVVSQDALLDEVWQGTVVSPNTLQRSIAQLRKAFGDDGREQHFIKTHAKQGYSLECDVRWQMGENQAVVHFQSAAAPSPELSPEPSPELSPETSSEPLIETSASTPKSSNPSTNESAGETTPIGEAQGLSRRAYIWVLPVILILGALAFWFVPNGPDAPSTFLTVKEMRTITATDNKEHSGAYSPDGKYIIFHRYSDIRCTNNIWAKSVETQREIQLTRELEAYGGNSISPDGKTLAFVKEQDCTAPITQKKCYLLMTLDFEAALVSPQTPTQELECRHSRIRQPIWLNNHEVALLKESAGQTKLIRYSLETKETQLLYTVEGGNIISYDFSPKQGLFGITAVHDDGEYYLDRITKNGQRVSSHKIIYPEQIAQHVFIGPRFTHANDHMVFSTGRQLFWLTSEGEITPLALPLDTPVGSPMFHPHALRMLVISGHYDSDIVQVTRGPDDLNVTMMKTLVRSNVGDYNGKIQPNGDVMAFTSGRAGGMQLWVDEAGQIKPLTRFPKDTFIDGIAWSSDGRTILVNANRQLHLVGLDGQTQAIDARLPVGQLLTWDSDNQIAYVNVRDKGVTKFAKLDTQTGLLTVDEHTHAKFAALTTNGELIYQDALDRFWQQGTMEDSLIEPIAELGSDRGFVIDNRRLVGLSDDSELWSYDIDSGELNMITTLPHKTDFITYADEEKILISSRVSAKKEVAEVVFNAR